MIEEDYPFACPYCGVELSARVDASGGRKQSFIQDCETCCKPIQIHVTINAGGEIVLFLAETAD